MTAKADEQKTRKALTGSNSGMTYSRQAEIDQGLEPIPKVVESDESFVIRYAAPESSTGGCRDVET
jgi:hypothetical protein